MPTVLRRNGFRFFFFSDEGSELPHIHVVRGDCVAKFWLVPIVLDDADDCKVPELARVEAIVTEHVEYFLERWHEFFGT
jgi:uncharacterized protein DUF4160